MEEAWKTALSDKLGNLLDALFFDKAQVSRAGDKMNLFLHADRLFSDSECEKVRSAFRGFFRGVSLNVRLSYPALGPELCAGIDKYRDYLIRRVGRESPGSQPALSHAGWRFENGALSLDFQDEVSAAFAHKRGVEKMLADILKDEFAVVCPVKVAVSGDEKERLRQIAERQQAENLRLSEMAAKAAAPAKDAPKAPPKVLYGRTINDPTVEIKELTEDAGRITLKGEVLKVETKPIKNDTSILVTFTLTDYTGTVYCKTFARVKGNDEERGAQQLENLRAALTPGAWVKVRGKYQMDSFLHEMAVLVDDINREDAPKRVDTAARKRVELHMHTQMSTMDGLSSASDLIKQAAKWGHPAVAITDHGVLQAFPEAFGAAKKNEIKLIPGCEGYLIDDAAQIVDMPDSRPVDGGTYVVLDVETTGLNTATDMIIEIGAVRIENGVEVKECSQLINPERPIPDKVVELTGITDGMVQGMPTIGDVIGDFAAFCEGAVLVAHNASFDMAFFDRAFRAAKLPFDHPKLDTLTLVRNLYPEQKSHKLGAMCKLLGVSLARAHRAVHDARATGQMMLIALEKLRMEHGQ